MSGENRTGRTVQPTLTRRSFLKTTGAVAGAAAIAGTVTPSLQALADAGDAEEGKKEEVYSSVCRAGCNGGCLLNAHVKDGKVFKITPGKLPDERYDKRMCLKGYTHIQRIYDPDRIKYPMKRVGDRGSGEWERISWDEAILTIADKWTELRELYGPESIAFTYQSGNMGNVCGGPMGGWLGNSLEAAQIALTVDMALVSYSPKLTGVGPAYNASAHAGMLQSKCIVLWGNNLTHSTIQAWRFIAGGKENGAKLVVIDTAYTGAAAKADLYMFIRPGTDAALACGMMNYIIENDKHDVNFIAKSTVGPFLVKASDGLFLRMSDMGVPPTEGPVDKKTGNPTVVDPYVVWDAASNGPVGADEARSPAILGSYTVGDQEVTTAFQLLKNEVAKYPVEKVLEICDIQESEFYDATNMICDNPPVAILPGFGTDHYTNGHYNIASILTLCAITGNYGVAGSGAGVMNTLVTYGNSAVGNLEGKTKGTSFAVLQLAHSLETGFVDPEKKQPCNVKSVYAHNSNWLGATAGLNDSIEHILPHLELIVTADTVMCDAAQYSDIVLPVAHYFEQDDCAGAFLLLPWVCLQEKAIDPLYEAKTDFEIWQLIGKRMDVGKPYWDMTQLDFLKKFFDCEASRAMGISLERLQKEKALPYFSPDLVFAEGGVFPNAYKRFTFYMEKPTPSSNYGQTFDLSKEHLPIRFEPPAEAWTVDAAGYPHTDLSEKYPFVFLQDHKRWRTHSQFAFVPWLRELDPEPYLYLNDKDAEEKGIAEGDTVKVFNDRGHVVLKAHVQPGMRRGTVNLAKGWHRGQYIEGHYQDLIGKTTNPFFNNTAFYDTLVDVEKA